MNIVLLANLIALLGAVIMTAIGFLKKQKQILGVQCLQFAIQGTGNLLLGGVTGAIANAVSIVRNLLCFGRKLTLVMKLVFIAAQAALSLLFNDAGLIGWLPVLAAACFTLAADTDNIIFLKAVIIFCQFLWAAYDLSIRNYVGVVFDLLAVITTTVGIVSILKDRRAQPPSGAGPDNEPQTFS